MTDDVIRLIPSVVVPSESSEIKNVSSLLALRERSIDNNNKEEKEAHLGEDAPEL